MTTEIEAKFIITDTQTRTALRGLRELANYALGRAQRKTMRDVYFDTPERTLLTAGYALRQRESGPGAQLTLKGLGGVQGEVHHREELEQDLSASLPPVEWPDGPVRERVQALVDDLNRLQPLCEIRQVRTVRPVKAGRRTVALWSLDHVTMSAGPKRLRTWELEIELTPDGQEEDLQRLLEALHAQFSLQAEPRSKFERALALTQLLSPQERALCTAIAQSAKARHAQRARLLLALDSGESGSAIAQRLGVSPAYVYRWRQAFQTQGLAGLFPTALLEQLQGQVDEKWAADRAAPIVTAPADSSSAEGESAPPIVTLTAPVPAARPKRSAPGLTPEDSLSEAFRKTLSFHFERMLEHEPGTRAGEDIEALHDMRVATRRMRAAFLVFGPYLDLTPLKPLRKGLRRTGRTLGAVRDLDVFREKVQHYLDTLPAERQDELAPLLDALTQQREAARATLLAYLNSPAYRHFVERFQSTLDQPLPEPPPLTADGPRPRNVCHLIPTLIFERWAAVRAFEPWIGLPDTPLTRYHQLRIAAKGLRYTLEYFSELLGKEAKLCLDRVKALQDHLGDLQDAVVACGLLRDYLTWGSWKRPDTPPAEPVIAPGVAAYLTYRQQEVQHLVSTFPPVWAAITDASFGQALLQALTRIVAP